MTQWQDIEFELLRMRQSWSCPRDLRNLGPADFSIRPVLGPAVQRYSRGRCMDFAVGLASGNPELSLVGLYNGHNLIHAFVMDTSIPPGSSNCVEVSGVWTLREMKQLHADDGPSSLKRLDLEQTLADMHANEQAGADFDRTEVILAVAGCLPHAHRYVPTDYIAADAAEAIARLASISVSEFADPSYVVDAVSGKNPKAI